mmetsp:Transcript_34029/g.79655  ORF Transcript_34029/g.79655 Transcript_34029/m.79655 type:complete len:376 (-) Transcript_34029:80-1207(-)
MQIAPVRRVSVHPRAHPPRVHGRVHHLRHGSAGGRRRGGCAGVVGRAAGCSGGLHAREIEEVGPTARQGGRVLLHRGHSSNAARANRLRSAPLEKQLDTVDEELVVELLRCVLSTLSVRVGHERASLWCGHSDRLDLSKGVESIAQVAVGDGGRDIADVESANRLVLRGDEFGQLVHSVHHLLSHRILYAIVTILDVLIGQGVVLLCRRVFVPVRAFIPARASAFDPEGANVCSIAVVVRIGTSHAQQSLVDLCFGATQRLASRHATFRLLREKLPVDVRVRDHFLLASALVGELVTKLQRKPILEIEQTGLTAVLEFGTCLANFCLLVPSLGTRLPPKDGERSAAHFAFLGELFARHANVGIFSKTCFTHDGKV